MQKQEQKPHSEASQLGRFMTKLRKEEAHQLAGPGRGDYLCLRGTRQSRGSRSEPLPITANKEGEVWSAWAELGGKMAFLC